MKTVIDELTGELVEVAEPNDLAIRELNEVGVIFDEYFDMKRKVNALTEQMEMWEFDRRQKIIEAMKKNGIKSIKTPEGSISYTEEGMQRRVDTDHLKQDGLYDTYSKWVTVKEHLTIRMKDK